MVNTIDWNKAYINERDYRCLPTIETEILSSLLTKNTLKPKLLDIGCGTGQLVRDMYHRGYRAFGVDLSSEAIKIAKRSSVFLGDSINFTTGNALEPIDDYYDIIVSKYVVAFLSSRDVFYKNVIAALNVDGVFVLITPRLKYLEKNKKSISLSDTLLTEELASHFRSVEKKSVNQDWWFICQN